MFIDIGTLLGMTFMLFSGAQQPDWAEIANMLVPSKVEILSEIKRYDNLYMEGDSVKSLSNLDPNEFRYTNYYELIQAVNRWAGTDRMVMSESMVDTVLPIIRLKSRLKRDSDGDSIIIRFEGEPVVLWHPDGIVFSWYVQGIYKDKLKEGGKAEAIEFVNKFLDEPYVFLIEGDLLSNYQYIGVIRDGEMVVYDRKMKQYDSIEDVIQKKYGSVKKYIEGMSKYIDFNDYDMDAIYYIYQIRNREL